MCYHQVEQGVYVCSACSGGDVLVQIRLGDRQTTQSSDLLFGVLLERYVYGYNYARLA